LGDFSYEVLDTKLARTAEPKHIMQLCVYSELLTDLQGLRPICFWVTMRSTASGWLTFSITTPTLKAALKAI